MSSCTLQFTRDALESFAAERGTPNRVGAVELAAYHADLTAEQIRRVGRRLGSIRIEGGSAFYDRGDFRILKWVSRAQWSTR